MYKFDTPTVTIRGKQKRLGTIEFAYATVKAMSAAGVLEEYAQRTIADKVQWGLAHVQDIVAYVDQRTMLERFLDTWIYRLSSWRKWLDVRRMVNEELKREEW